MYIVLLTTTHIPLSLLLAGHGTPVVKRDFVFATTPVELSMVGTNNPPAIQSIIDMIQIDGASADEVMFKMSWTSNEHSHSNR